MLTHSPDGETVPAALTPERIAEVVALVKAGTVSRTAGKKVLARFDWNVSASTIPNHPLC